MGLGVEIVKQLGKIAGRDLLASWMAEYLGEKISACNRARGKQREALEKECAELIFKLWNHRYHLPDGSRPLESFEPIFDTLNELSQDKPRFSALRNLPSIDESSEVGKIVRGVLAIDRSASLLIRYFLAEAVEKIPKSDKRWASIRMETERTPWDIYTVRILIDDEETILENQEKLKQEQREKLKNMLKNIENIDKYTAPLRALLEKKIKAIK